MTEYRWARASRGEIPTDACEEGHGWEFQTRDDSSTPQVPLWVMRTIAGTEPFGEAVRVGCVRRGGPANVDWRGDHGTPVDEYEVLLDQGTWEWMDTLYEIEGVDDSAYDVVPVGAVACGHDSDGATLYAAIEHRDDDMGGEIPSETGMWAETNWERTVLIDPVAAKAESSTPRPARPVPAPEPAKPVVAALDLKEEAVAIANAGGVAIDISGWKLRDDSTRKPFTFPAGTTLAPGASIVVRSGSGAANATAGQLVWTTASAWNDRGDTATLMDASGKIISAQKGH
jgi:Lamin Tail Domain